MDNANEIHCQDFACLSWQTVAMRSGFGIIKTKRFPNYLNLTYRIRSHGTKKPSGYLFEFVYTLRFAARYILWQHINPLPCVIGHNEKST